MSLMTMVTLDFIRPPVQTTDRYGNFISVNDSIFKDGLWNNEGLWIGSMIWGEDNTEIIQAQGSLQPYKPYQNRTIPTEAGYNYQDMKVFYTKTRLKAASEKNQTPPDYCSILGDVYKVFDEGNLSDFFLGSSMAHYEVILVKAEH